MSQRANISVRIVPAGIGYHPGLIGPFEIYDFDRVATDHVGRTRHSTAFLHEPEQTAGHRPLLSCSAD